MYTASIRLLKARNPLDISEAIQKQKGREGYQRSFVDGAYIVIPQILNEESFSLVIMAWLRT